LIFSKAAKLVLESSALAFALLLTHLLFSNNLCDHLGLMTFLIRSSYKFLKVVNN
jgi:hypothetical protein